MNAFGMLSPNFEAKYRERSNAAPISLVRKKCDCGTTITAKQMKRHGKCDPCVEAAK